MTIIEPKKKKSKNKLFFLPLTLFILGAFLGVFFYADIVNLRHELADWEKKVRQLEIDNSELKNKRYSMFDKEGIRKTASEFGLILEKKPAYLEIQNDELASRF